MNIDHDLTTEDGKGRRTPEVSAATLLAYGAAGLLLLAWFLHGWLVQRKGLVDSVGEAAGLGFALLLAVAVIGSFRRPDR